MPKKMGIERNKAMLILGFLFKKGFLDCSDAEFKKICHLTTPVL